MGTTSQKLTYLNETKQELKQKINNLGGEITDETTFREYTNQLQEVYDRLPKTEYQEGSNITLSNTLKGKLDFEDDIVGYGDTSQKSYQGYNELNLQDYTETINGVTITIKNGVIMLNGNSTNYTTKVIPQATTSQFNGEYNLNYEYVSGTTNNPANLNLYNGSQEIATLYFGNLSRNQSVTFNQDTISTRIYFHNNAEFNNYIIKPMLYKGAYDSSKTFEPFVGNSPSPNPSYPQEVKVVRGKNKWGGFSPFTKTQGGLTFITNTDGSIDISGTATEICTSSTIAEAITNNLFIKLEKGTYSVSGGGSNYVIQIYDKNANIIANTQLGTTSVTFTLTQTTEIMCRVFIDSGGTIFNTKAKVQLEERKCSYFLSTL